MLTRALEDLRDSDVYPFHMPGHKRRLFADGIFEDIYGIDITEIDGFDDLHNAKGIIREAQERAAGLFCSDETHFLVNGSTGGILAAINALAGEGDNIIIAANCHRSVYNALMLCGAKPYVITPERESYFDIFGGIRAKDVREALEKAGKAAAVVITSPTYEGITSDISEIADICHRYEAALIVDAAHGAHFGFSNAFPKNAVTLGADVEITSVHKTLPSMTQTALIHINRNCPHKERIRNMLTVFMTSSPSYVLMASIDSMVRLLEQQGSKLFDAYEKRLDDLYDKAGELECLSILCKEKLTAEGSYDFDRSKIVVSDMTGTYTGVQLSDMLRSRGMETEMSASSYVILMTGIADTDEGFSRLKEALTDIDDQLANARKPSGKRGIIRRLWDMSAGKMIAEKIRGADIDKSGICPAITEHENNMRQAMFEDDIELIPVELSEGRIAKDMVSVYPPGIPVMIRGERITGAQVDTILAAMKEGLNITGLENKEIAVLWEKSST